MALPDRFLDELRARLPLSRVVGRRVALIKKGPVFMGLCPFHNEKTPSFKVDDDKGFFHCFGCGEHGDIFAFEMRTAGVPFPEAVERLAGEAGLEVPKATPKDREIARKKADARSVLEDACQVFERALRGRDGFDALDYLKRRGLDDATIRRFRLGFAPPGGALKTALMKDGVTESFLVDLGLLTRGRDGKSAYDTFRNRVIFPIADAAGRIVAFGGRIMGDGQPKYLNSPETDWFHKGRTLYNYSIARDAVRDSGALIVVEGYMDVIAFSRAGIAGAVAPLGTALTEAQLEILWKTVPEPILCFDGDGAGQRALERAMDRALPLLTPGRSLRFVLMPPGQDPDDILAQPNGEARLKQLVATAMPLSDMAWHTLSDGRPLDRPEQRAAFEGDIARFADKISDRTVKTHFHRDLKDRFWEKIKATRGNARESGRRGGASWPAGRDQRLMAPPPVPAAPWSMLERILLGAVIRYPELFDSVAERLGGTPFREKALDLLRQAVVIALSSGESLDTAGLKDHLTLKGFGTDVESLLGVGFSIHARAFEVPDDPGWVVACWDHAFDMYMRLTVGEDLNREAERLKGDLTQEAFERFVTYKGEDVAVSFHNFKDFAGKNGKDS